MISDKNTSAKFLNEIAAPARRALEGEDITSVKLLSKWSEADLLKLHGVGPSTLPKLRKALKEEGLTFKK